MVRIVLARLCLLAVIIALVPKVYADRLAGWARAQSTHFDLYTTTNSERKQIVDALARLEQVHDFFEQTSFGKTIPSEPVRIMVCSGEPDCEAYRISRGAYAYYQRTLRRDYIVMRDLDPEHYDVAVHEYTHFIVEHAGLKLPLWLNEGFADLYSTVEIHGNQPVLGKPINGRLIALRSLPRMSLETLFSVSAASPYYRQPDLMQAFYSQSWALTHMLAMSENYASRFGDFLTAVSNGTSPGEALRAVYGKEIASVSVDLQTYLSRRFMLTRPLEVTVARAACDPTITLSTPRDIDQSFADLLGSNPYLRGEAEGRLTALSQRYPEASEFEESLGYLTLEQNRTDEARAHFRAAVERRSTDSLTLFYCAKLEEQAGGQPDKVMMLLERALEIKPDYQMARLELGFRATRARNYKLAIASLEKIKAVDAAYSYELAYTLAFCYGQMNQIAEAKAQGLLALGAARTAEQQRQAEELLRFIS